MDKDFKSHYKELLNLVEEKIQNYIKITEPKVLYEPYNYIMSIGGKRIRPLLTMISCGAINQNPTDALDAAVSMEILHNFTLVHDDIMDKSPMRRGNPTVHTKWDEPIAIITGDVMVGSAYKLLGCYKNHKNFARILEAFTEALIEVCEGQALDMEFNSRKDVTIDNYLQMIEKKTAKLLESCVLLGGSIAGGNDWELEALYNYAKYLGIGFQIQDDLLDLTANQAKLGKKIGQDIIEGKKTFLIIKSLELAEKSEDRELLNLFYEKKGLDESYIPKFNEMLNRLGVFVESKKLAGLYFNQSLESLSGLKDNHYVQMLAWVTDSLRDRSY